MGINDKFYSTFDVARLCRVSPGSVSRWIKEGRLQASVTAGGHHRISGKDLGVLMMRLGISASEDSGSLNEINPHPVHDTILFVGFPPEILSPFELDFKPSGCAVEIESDPERAVEKLAEWKSSISVCVFFQSGLKEKDFLRTAKKIRPEVEFLAAGTPKDLESAQVLSRGAYDILPTPLDYHPFIRRIENAREFFRLKETLRTSKLQDEKSLERIHHLEKSRETVQGKREQAVRDEKLSSIGRFVNGVAHEINNPLTAIIGYSQLLLENPVPENMAKPLKILNDQAKRCGKILQDLMVFVSRKPLESAQWVRPGEMIQSVLKEFEEDIRRQEINVVFDDNLSGVKLWGDEEKLKKAFADILKNAIQAMEKMEARRRLMIKASVGRDVWRVLISDNGVGIPREALDKIFDPFFTTREIGQGAGLGLSMALGIIRDHGGTICAASEPGRGSAFTVEIPLKLRPADGPEDGFSSGDA